MKKLLLKGTFILSLTSTIIFAASPDYQHYASATTTEEKSVNSLESATKKLEKNFAIVKKNLKVLDQKTLDDTNKKLTSANKVVNGLKKGKAKTSYLNRVAKSEKSIKGMTAYNKAIISLNDLNASVKKLDSNLKTSKKTLVTTESKLTKSTKTLLSTAKSKNKSVTDKTLNTQIAKKIVPNDTKIKDINNYNNAINAGKRMLESKVDFESKFSDENILGSLDVIKEHKTILNKEKKLFNSQSDILKNLTKKFYDPAYAPILKYEASANAAVLLEEFDTAFSSYSDFVTIRKKYEILLTKINALSEKKYKTEFTKRLKDILREMEPSTIENYVTSPDTSLLVMINKIQISKGSKYKYVLNILEENANNEKLTSGDFKIHFKDGTSTLIKRNTNIMAFEYVESTVSFETEKEAYLIEYGKNIDIKKEGISIGTVFWKLVETQSDPTISPEPEVPEDSEDNTNPIEEEPEEDYWEYDPSDTLM